jgi:hypothetical protein
MKYKSRSLWKLAIFILIVLLFQPKDLVISQTVEECGFSSIRQKVLLKLVQAPQRPTLSGPEINIITDNFRIHYTDSGDDATSRVWAESVAVAAEYCRSVLTSLNWAMPPDDGILGGDSKYDIYIRNTLRWFYYGIAIAESLCTNPYPDGYSSWIEIYKDSIPEPFRKYPRLRALVAHEFHHACQMRYSNIEDAWFYENTSVYIENVIYKDINTLKYRIDNSNEYNPIQKPDLPINYQGRSEGIGPYPYTGALWPKFLHERFNADIPRRIWERIGSISGKNIVSSINWALYTYASSNLSNALKEYAVWRYFTGTRADQYHFKDVDSLPEVSIVRLHGWFPASGNQPVEAPISLGGTNYIQFTNGAPGIRVTFARSDSCMWGAYLVGHRPSALSYQKEIILDPYSYSGVDSIDWVGVDTAVLISTVLDTTGGFIGHYSYTANQREGASVVFENVINNENAGGFLILDKVETLESGDYRFLIPNSNHEVKTLNVE